MHKLTLMHGNTYEVDSVNVYESAIGFEMARQTIDECLDIVNAIGAGAEAFTVESDGTVTEYTGGEMQNFLAAHEDEWHLTVHLSFDAYTTQEQEELDMMAYIWANQIIIGRKTIDDIKNAVLKEQVKQVLIDMGLPELAGVEESEGGE